MSLLHDSFINIVRSYNFFYRKNKTNKTKQKRNKEEEDNVCIDMVLEGSLWDKKLSQCLVTAVVSYLLKVTVGSNQT